MTNSGLGGKRLVVFLYLGIVAFTGVAGVLFSRVIDNPEPPRLFFLIELPPTDLGFAIYGMVTLAVVLGIFLALVVYVSDRFDDASPGRDDAGEDPRR
ncbi:DUF7520 family protein [Haloferacaceae archaeon DSL9]